MFVNFGPATVTHSSSSLGDTYGGGSLRLEVAEARKITSDFDYSQVIVGGEGNLNFYSWPSTINVTSSLQLKDFGTVVIDTTKVKITLHKCKILLAGEMDFGTFDQRPIKTRLVFTPDSSGNVITLE